MAATIKTTLTDNSKEWVAELKARFIAAGGSAEGFEAHLESLNKELDSRQAAKATQQIKKLADEFAHADPMAAALAETEERVARQTKKMGAAMDAAGFDAKEAAEQMERYRASAERAGAAASAVKPANLSGGLRGFTASGITAAASSITALASSIPLIGQAVRMSYHAVEAMGEVSPKFATLKKSIDGIAESAVIAGQRFAVMDFGSKKIEQVSWLLDGMGKRIERMPFLFEDMNVATLKAKATVQDWLGMETAATHELLAGLKAVNAARDAELAAIKRAAEIVESTKNVEAVRAANRKAEHDVAVQAWAESLDSHAAINNAIREEAAALEKKRTTDKVSEEDARASLAKTAALQARLRRLDAEWDAKKKADDAELKAKGEAAAAEKVAKAKQTNDEIVAAEKAHLASMQSAHEEFHKKKFEAAQAAKAAEIQLEVNAAKAKADLLAKRAEQHQGNAAFLVGGQDPRAVAKQVADNRKKQAMDAYGKANSKDYMRFKNASNSIKGELKNIDRPDSAKGQKERKRLLEAKRFNDRKAAAFVREQKQVGMKARGQGFRDAVRGNVGSDEVVGAQQDLANKVINQGESTGKLNQSQAEVLRAATGVLQRQQAEQRAIADDLENTKQTLRSMMLGGGKSPRQAGR